MKYIYYRQEEGNDIKEKISKDEVIKLLEGYDTWTEKKLFEVLHAGSNLHPTFYCENKKIKHYKYWSEEK